MTPDVRRCGPHSARRRLLATAVAILAVSACRTTRPTIVPPTPTSSRLAQLQRGIDAVLANPAVSRGTWGVAVKSLAQLETLYSRNADSLLMPASTMKVLTLAVAVDRLGWDFQFVTSALLLGPLEDGVLKGDLLIVGAGDPTIENWNGTPLFDAWIAQLRAQGLRRIEGRIIGDDNLFDDDGLGKGWMWDDLAASYSAPVSALQFNQNSAQIVATPGASPGDTPMVEIVPSWAPVTIRSLARTTGADTSASLTMRPAGRSTILEIDGNLPVGSARVIRTVAVPNPTLYFAIAARSSLMRQGVEVTGEAADLDEIDFAPDRSRATLFGAYTTSIRDLARPMMKLSPNLYAESLLKTLAARATGRGSAEAGRASVQTTLARWGISADDVVIADGSGLSRYNLVTPNAMVAVLAHVFADDRLRERFQDTLPIAGVDGTLAERMKGTAAHNNARAKTGSFANARAIAGYVRTADGEPLAFSITANNYNTETSRIDAMTDSIVIALAEFRR